MRNQLQLHHALLRVATFASLSAILASHAPTAAVSPRQSGTVIELAGQVGGLVSTLVADGRYAFVGVGPRVAVLDLEDPAGPRPVAWSVVLPAPVLDLALVEGRLVAAAGKAGLLVLDRADPFALRLVGQTAVDGTAYQVVAAGRYAYTTAGTRLAVVALDGPDGPQLAHTVALGTRSAEMEVNLVLQGDRLFVGFPSYGVGVIDVADPEQANVAGWNEDVRCTTLAAGDGFVAVFGWGVQGDGTSAGSVKILSLDPREFLRPVGHLAAGVRYPVETMAVAGRMLYLRWGLELQAVSVEDLAQPVIRHRIAFPLRGSNHGIDLSFYRTRQMLVHSSRLYVVHNGGGDADHTQSGVLVFDTDLQAGFTANGGWLADMPGDVSRAETAGEYLVLQEFGAEAMRLFRPLPDGSLERLGAIPLANGSHNFAVDPPWLYFVDTLASAPWLYAIDVSDPHVPRMAARHQRQQVTSSGATLTARQSRVYVTLTVPSETGGTVLDLEVRRPMPDGSLALTGLLPTACVGAATDMVIHGDQLVLTCRTDGLVLVDIADPDRPRRTGHVPFDASAEAVFTRGHLAYVAARWPTPPEEQGLSPRPRYGGLRIIDLRSLTELGTYRNRLDFEGNGAWDVAVVGRYALLTSDARSVRVVDMADPARPALVQELTLPTVVGKLAVVGDSVYVTGRNGGLYRLRWRVDPGPDRAEGVYLPFATVRRRGP